MEYFLSLPEGCISQIFSLTSRKDTVTSSAVSRGFKFIVESDVVWENLLPSDYQHIICRSSSLLDHSPKKELYFSLCNSPILLDGGKLQENLNFSTGNVYTPWYWAESRFSEVSHFPFFRRLNIRGKIASKIVSKRTTYVVYLVYKVQDAFDGFGSVN
uniref:F-box protein SKIP3-like n=1 Tax=Nicotiana tabacum TaxID=4097 RepID=A0A1S3ZB45_TOBAC|nr:PREDICTED: F-box protein SKIP3-like [Nicotiana tabacum]